jgi:hypothetical protein
VKQTRRAESNYFLPALSVLPELLSALEVNRALLRPQSHGGATGSVGSFDLFVSLSGEAHAESAHINPALIG